MFTKKKMLAGFLTLAMLLSLMTGMLVPAWAAGTEAVAPELSIWDPTSITVKGVEGQEYVIAPKGSDADWSKAVEPEDGFVTFEGLTPVTAYVIYTRVKADAGEPKTTELTTDLAGLGYWSATDLIVGAVLNLETDPEDAQGLTFQWYHDTITPIEEGVEYHDLTPIDGATSTTYTVTEADLGKYLAVKAFKDEAEVGGLGSIGPVSDGSDIPEEETCPRDESCPISRFTDSNPEAWYHDGVHWALEQGLMNGTSETTFSPNGTATRAMVVTMLWRLEGEPAAEKTASFTDVSADAWYADAVNWAAEVGAVNGTSATTFSPNAPVTREQLAAILYRFAQAKGQGFTGTWVFLLDAPDTDKISDYANEAMHWMVMNGVITGMDDGTLAPQDNATRAQIATMFQRFCGTLEESGPEPDETQSDDLYLILVNKTHKLPENWENKIELLEMMNAYDEDILVEKGSYEAFLLLREALLKEGVDIELDSCYRSVARQEELWAEFEEEYGIAYCRQYVAVPGFSEHHTGFAVDVCLKKDGELIYDNDEMMKETAIWETVHVTMPEYGFILRYMEGKEDITGYAYEPWHMRYVGDPEIAKTITEKGITLEEYLGQVEPADATVDYGTSTLYTRDEMNAAISLILDEFGTWEGCELHSISYAGDACNSAENIKWVNEIKPGKNYIQCIEFLSDFHSPVEGGGTWEPDQEYTDWQWWLARTDSGDWELVSWGY